MRPGGGISSAHAPDLDLPARFMVLGMVDLLAVAVLAPFAVPLFAGSFSDLRLLAFVHLNTLGVVAAVILGATYQLVPVVLQTPLASVRVGRLSFWAFLVGLSFLLPGLLTLRHWAMGTGATLLVVAFLLYIGVVGTTLRRAQRWDVVAWHLAVALVGLAGGIFAGLLLAGSKGNGFLGAMTYPLLGAHVTFLLAAWVPVLLAGVAYRLVGMFTLAEDALWRPAAWAGLVLMTGGAWLLIAAFLLRTDPVVRLVAALAIAAGQILFAAQLVHLYRARRRRGFDVHIPFALVSAGGGTAAALLLVAGMALGAAAVVGAVGGCGVADAGWAGRDGDPGLLLQDRHVPRLAPPVRAARRAPACAAPGGDVLPPSGRRRVAALDGRVGPVARGCPARERGAGAHRGDGAGRGPGLLPDQRGPDRGPRTVERDRVVSTDADPTGGVGCD